MARFRQQMADTARGEKLRKLRDARHLNQEDAAHEIGVSTKTLRTWEKGGPIKWPNAKAAAKFYGVEPEALVEREDGEPIDLMESLAGAEPISLAEIEEMLRQVLDQQARLLADISEVRSEQERLSPQIERLARGRASKRSQ